MKEQKLLGNRVQSFSIYLHLSECVTERNLVGSRREVFRYLLLMMIKRSRVGNIF